MKSSYLIYKKLREAKYFRLVALYKRYLKKTPSNCRYNYLYSFNDDDGSEYKIRLCLLHQEDKEKMEKVYPNLIEVCQNDCRKCNGFLPRYSKEDIQKIFNEEAKKGRYPEICALEWVLERSAADIPPFGLLESLCYKIKAALFYKHKKPKRKEDGGNSKKEVSAKQL